jgi:hypothetical protein
MRSPTIRVRIAQERDPGAYVDTRWSKGSDFRHTTKRVLTIWHAGCTFMVSQTRTGAIPEAESQQNADGLDASLDCRRSALSELGVGLRHIVAVRTTPAQGSPTALRRSTPNDGFNSYLDALRSS